VGECPPTGGQPPAISPNAPGNSIVEKFEAQIRAYLDGGGSRQSLEAILGELSLTDGDTTWQAKAQVATEDLTGNGTADVVVSLAFYVPSQYADSTLFVFVCEEGHYEGGAIAVMGGAAIGEEDVDPGIRAIADLNGDGIREIAFSYVEILGTHANFTRVFRIIGWDGQEFADLVESEGYPPNGAAVMNGDGQFRDTDGDGTLELELTNGVGRGYMDSGPQRRRVDTWAWDGSAFLLSHSEYEPPAYRFQAVQDGDAASLRGEYGQAMDLYQRAISDGDLLGWSRRQLWPDDAYGGSPTPTPDPGERSRLSAYAHYRIMLLHLLHGKRDEALVAYRALGDGFPSGNPGHSYAALGTAFWEAQAASGGLRDGCAGAVEYARAHVAEILEPLGSGFYGTAQRDYQPEDVCPFE
jgi:hypothetical protein